MKVRVFGFELHVGNGISHDEFFSNLEQFNGREFDEQILTVVKEGDYWTGLFIRIKDAKAYCQFQRDGKEFTLSPVELEKGTSMADFNFFIVYAKTGRGLYQHYHNSTHVTPFCAFLKKRYDLLKRERIAEETTNGMSAADATKKFAKSLRYSIICRKETLEQRLEQWKQVRELEFEFATLDFEHDPLTPLAKVAKKRSERFIFGKDNFDLVKAGITDFLGKKMFSKLRVEGVDPQGHVNTYKLQNDYDTFGEFEYNDLIRLVSIDSNDLVGSVKNSQIVQTLLSLANAKANALLTTPVI